MNMTVYLRLKHYYINFSLQATLALYLKVAAKMWCLFVSNLQRYDTISVHVPKHEWQFASEKLQYTGMTFI